MFGFQMKTATRVLCLMSINSRWTAAPTQAPAPSRASPWAQHTPLTSAQMTPSPLLWARRSLRVSQDKHLGGALPLAVDVSFLWSKWIEKMPPSLAVSSYLLPVWATLENGCIFPLQNEGRKQTTQVSARNCVRHFQYLTPGIILSQILEIDAIISILQMKKWSLRKF